MSHVLSFTDSCLKMAGSVTESRTWRFLFLGLVGPVWDGGSQRVVLSCPSRNGCAKGWEEAARYQCCECWFLNRQQQERRVAAGSSIFFPPVSLVLYDFCVTKIVFGILLLK